MKGKFTLPHDDMIKYRNHELCFVQAQEEYLLPHLLFRALLPGGLGGGEESRHL